MYLYAEAPCSPCFAPFIRPWLPLESQLHVPRGRYLSFPPYTHIISSSYFLRAPLDFIFFCLPDTPTTAGKLRYFSFGDTSSGVSFSLSSLTYLSTTSVGFRVRFHHSSAFFFLESWSEPPIVGFFFHGRSLPRLTPRPITAHCFLPLPWPHCCILVLSRSTS